MEMQNHARDHGGDKLQKQEMQTKTPEPGNYKITKCKKR